MSVLNKLLLTLVFLVISSIARSQNIGSYYLPFQKILAESRDIEDRLDAQDQLLFSNIDPLAAIIKTEKLIQKNGNKVQQHRTNLQKAFYYFTNKNTVRAKGIFTSVENSTFATDTLFLLIKSTSQYRDSNSNKIVNRLSKYNDYLFRRDNNYTGLYKLYFLNKLSYSSLKSDLFDTSLLYLNEAIYLTYNVNRNPNLAIKTSLNSAKQLEYLGDYYGSLNILKELELALDTYGSSIDKLDYAASMSYNLGSTGSIEQSKEYLLQVICMADDSMTLKGSSLLNYGLYHLYNENKDSAVEYFSKAEKILNSKKGHSHLGHLYVSFMYCYNADEKEFHKYRTMAKEYVKNSEYMFAFYYLALARNEDQPALALSYTDSAIVLLTNLKRDKDLKAALLDRYSLLITFGKGNEADECQQQIDSINKLLKKQELQSKLTSINFKSTLFQIKNNKELVDDLALPKRKKSRHRIIVFSGLAFVVLALLSFYLLHFEYKNRRLKASLKAYKKEADLAAAKADLLIEKNVKFIKNEVSQELHDNILSAVSGLRLMSEVILLKSSVEKQVDISIIEKMHEALQASYKDVESYIDHLRFNTKPSSSIQYIEELEPYIKSVLEPLGINSLVTFSSGETAENLSDEKAFEIIRVSKELINNIIKHSEASMVTFRVEIRDAQLVLTCLDNGKGFDTAKEETRGLRNLRDRVATLNGEIDIVSNRGKGTLVNIQCPI